MEMAEVRPGAAFDFSMPQPLFDTKSYLYLSGAPFRQFDISPDGKRFVAVKQATPASGAFGSLVIVQNWFAELKARMPGR